MKSSDLDDWQSSQTQWDAILKIYILILHFFPSMAPARLHSLMLIVYWSSCATMCLFLCNTIQLRMDDPKLTMWMCSWIFTTYETTVAKLGAPGWSTLFGQPESWCYLCWEAPVRWGTLKPMQMLTCVVAYSREVMTWEIGDGMCIRRWLRFDTVSRSHTCGSLILMQFDLGDSHGKILYCTSQTTECQLSSP